MLLIWVPPHKSSRAWCSATGEPPQPTRAIKTCSAYQHLLCNGGTAPRRRRYPYITRTLICILVAPCTDIHLYRGRRVSDINPYAHRHAFAQTDITNPPPAVISAADR